MRVMTVSVTGREGNGQGTEVGKGASAASGVGTATSWDWRARVRHWADSVARSVGLASKSRQSASDERSAAGGGSERSRPA